MPDFGRFPPSGGDPSLNEINRADRFFEALASKQPVYSTDPAEAELAFLFAEFRDDVRDAPITAPVSGSDADEALRGGLATNRGPRRGFAIVGSVAAAMLCIGGFGTAVYGAGPGDSLYGIRTTIFGQQEQTREDQVSLASAQLQQVQQLIDQGQWQQAQDKLVAVSSAVQGVDQVESKQQLVEQWNALTYKVVEQNPAATLPPGEPLPVLPSSPLTWLPVPVVQAPTSESTSSSSSTTSSPSSSSETAVTSDTSSSTVPPETLMTAPSESSSLATPSPSVASAAPSASASTTTSPPSPSTPTSTVTSTVPSSTTTTVASTSPSKAPEALVPTSTSALPPPVVQGPTSTVAEVPASQPRAVTSSSVAPPPAVSAPSSASVASSQPAPSTAAPQRPTVTPTTTVVPQSGGVS